MHAFISGQAGIAITVEGMTAKIIRVDTIEVETSCGANNVSYVFQGANDIQFHPVVDKKSVRNLLKAAWENDRALFFILVLLSLDEDTQSYKIALECLDELLNSNGVEDFVLNRMFMEPLPDSNNLAQAMELAVGYKNILPLLKAINEYQKAIAEADERWETIPESIFGNEITKHQAKCHLGQLGMQRKLVLSMCSSEAFSQFQFEFYKDCRFLSNSRKILPLWTEKLKPECQQAPNQLRYAHEREDDFQDNIVGGMEVSNSKQFAQAKSQMARIRELLNESKEDLAKRFAAQLVAEQVASKNLWNAARSLCNIAQTATQMANYALALDWTKQATELAPDEGWAHGQLAECFFKMHRYSEAESHFRKSAEFGERAYGLGGIARLARRNGDLDAALKQYEELAEEFPTDVSVIVGKAHTLANIHRYDEALKEFDKAIKLKPEDVSSYEAKANAFRYMGQLKDALELYNRIIRDFQEASVISYCGKAACLKDMGEIKQAVDFYHSTIKKFSNDPKAYMGLGEILSEIGQHDNALKIYDEAKTKFNYLTRASLGYATSLHELGRDAEAEKVYESLRTSDSPHLYGDSYARFLKSNGRYEEALQQYDKNIQASEYNTAAWIGRAKVLKVLGKLSDAVDSYDRVLAIRPFDTKVKLAKAALLVAAERMPDAQSILNEIIIKDKPQTRTDWIAHHIKGMALIMGRSPDAIEYLKKAFNDVPYADLKKSFAASLATAEIREEQYHPALTRTLKCDLQHPYTYVLQLHAYSALGGELNQTRAKAALEKLRGFRLEASNPLMLLANTIVGITSPANDNWVVNAEERQAWLLVA